MAQNTTITLAAQTWTQLTDADVSSITFQNRSSYHMFVKATTDTTTPTDFDGAIRYNPGQGEMNTNIADLFPGLSGADRVWAYSDKAVDVMVSHA